MRGRTSGSSPASGKADTLAGEEPEVRPDSFAPERLVGRKRKAATARRYFMPDDPHSARSRTAAEALSVGWGARCDGPPVQAALPSMTALKSNTHRHQPVRSSTTFCTAACAVRPFPPWRKRLRRGVSSDRSGLLSDERVCLSARRKADRNGRPGISPALNATSPARAGEVPSHRSGRGHSSNAGSSALRVSIFSEPSSPTLTKA